MRSNEGKTGTNEVWGRTTGDGYFENAEKLNWLSDYELAVFYVNGFNSLNKFNLFCYIGLKLTRFTDLADICDS